jgi:hypothetical protein
LLTSSFSSVTANNPTHIAAIEAAGSHERQPLELESSHEDEDSSQQVIFVTDPKDDSELFEMAKSKKSSWDV